MKQLSKFIDIAKTYKRFGMYKKLTAYNSTVQDIRTIDSSYSFIISLAEDLLAPIPIGEQLLELAIPLVLAGELKQINFSRLYCHLLSLKEDSLEYKKVLKEIYETRFNSELFQEEELTKQYEYIIKNISPKLAYYIFNNIGKSSALTVITSNIESFRWDNNNPQLLQKVRLIEQMLSPFLQNLVKNNPLVVESNKDFYNYLLLFWREHVAPMRNYIAPSKKQISFAEMFNQTPNNSCQPTQKYPLKESSILSNQTLKKVVSMIDTISLELSSINFLLKSFKDQSF